MRNLEIYQATVPDIICKGGTAAPTGKGSGIEAYSAAENDDVQRDPDQIGEMVTAGLVIHVNETRVQVLHEDGRDATSESKSAKKRLAKQTKLKAVFHWKR